MKAILALCVLSLVGSGVHGISKTCDLFTGTGCTAGGPFSFSFQGTHNTPNSLCNRRYKLIANVPAVKTGFSCTMTMDVPQQYKYIYSISTSATATYASSTAPYIYGYGLNAYIRPKYPSSSTSPYRYNSWNYRNIHRHQDDNHYNTITYRFENNKLTMYSSSGESMTAGHPYLWSVTSPSTQFYIGLNQRYADNARMGSGVCKITCYDYGSIFSLSADSVGQREAIEGPAPQENPEFERELSSSPLQLQPIRGQ